MARRTRHKPLPYHRFRSGLDYGDVAEGLRAESWRVFEREGRRMFVTRHTILGRWHEIKRHSYLAYVQAEAEAEADRRALAQEMADAAADMAAEYAASTTEAAITPAPSGRQAGDLF